ncbi:hypothetical protein T484DRAFT_1780252 [Baffinella frigidus]|nr:hypothetical protein T484DRAFT_1780252 [Cryptophyta sp. CCMP2293]
MSDADTDKSVAENSGGSERNQTAGKILGGVIGKMAASSWKAAQTGKTFRLKFPEGAEASGSKLASSWNGMLAGASGAVSGASGAVRNRTLEAAGAGARAAAGAGERVSKADLTAARSYAANVSSSFISFTRGGANRKVAVKSQDELEAALREGISVHRMDIRGRSQPWRQSENGTLLSEALDGPPTLRGDGRDKQLDHPVLRVISQRVREGSKPGQRTDNYKIALAIEGGGLRGSVSAGMASAIMHLGMADSFDMVLGSSAGSIVGSYLVARAEPAMTYQFFCNHLTTSREKLNGTSWLDLAVMVLDYPMKTLMQELLPVNWNVFKQNDKHQPMKVIASGLFSEGPVVLGSEEGSFSDLASLCECVKASCMLPGVAGVQPPWLKGSSAFSPEKLRAGQRRWSNQELSATVWTKAREAFIQQTHHRQPKAAKPDSAGGGAGMFNQAMQRIMSPEAEGEVVEQIDKVQLQAALSAIDIKVSDEELDNLFEMCDVDQNGAIDISEFKAMVFSILAKKTPDRWLKEGSVNLFPPGEDSYQVEPMVDALVYEPIPYRSAIEYGATHVLVLRSFPDGRKLPKSLLGLFERVVAPKCLAPFPKVREHLLKEGHSVAYAEDVLRLNRAVVDLGDEVDEIEMVDARDVGRAIARQNLQWVESIDGKSSRAVVPGVKLPANRDPYLMAIAPLDTDGEALSSLELNRAALLRGIMQGFARAYDVLAPDGPEGMRIATGNQVHSEHYGDHSKDNYWIIS